MEREEIVSQLNGITLRNIDLTGLTLVDELVKAEEEEKEFKQALLGYLYDKHEVSREHLLEELCDTIQVKLSVMKTIDIDIEEIATYWNTKHLEKIKFRAWNKRHKVMIYDIQKGEEFATRLEMESQEVMQYTGLKDKNDKEIYEGDIIQFVWEDDSCWGKAGTYKGYIGFNQGAFEVVYIDRDEITVFDDGGWHENSKSDDMQSFISWSEDIEVIGNIYENPELLETCQ